MRLLGRGDASGQAIPAPPQLVHSWAAPREATSEAWVDRQPPAHYKPPARWALPFSLAPLFEHAQVAQLVEHATENRSVGGSIPPLGTIISMTYGARS